MWSILLIIGIVLISIAVAGRKVIQIYQHRVEQNANYPKETTPQAVPPTTPGDQTVKSDSLVPYILTQDVLDTLRASLEHTNPLYALYIGQQLLLYLPIHQHTHSTTHGLIPYPEILSSLNVAPSNTYAKLEIDDKTMYLLKIELIDAQYLKVNYTPVVPHQAPSELLINPDQHDFSNVTYMKISGDATPQEPAQLHTNELAVRKIEETKDTASPIHSDKALW